MKHDLRHKARFVAGGHLTDPPKDSVYSGVVSLRSLRLVALLAELNGLELWAANVGNAYLEASTKEKVYIIARPEFGDSKRPYNVDQEGTIRFTGHRELGGTNTLPTRCVILDSNHPKPIPMFGCASAHDYYEYVCVYVDDLAIAMREPQLFIYALINTYGYKLKGVGPMSCHLGADIYRDSDGTLCYGAKSYIGRMMINYENYVWRETERV